MNWRTSLGKSGPEQPHLRGHVEFFIWQTTNQMRADHGLPPLLFSEKLRLPAYQYSRDMNERRFFSHTSPEGKRLADRLKDHGIRLSWAGENLIMLDTNRTLVANAAERDALGKTLVKDWMGSPGHRENILTPEFRQIGVGAFISIDDVYATQIFGSI